MKSVNTDIAYGYIRKKILEGEYKPGQELATGVLAPQIGVSRTPVRDALRKLEGDGLVTIRTHLGASVKRMDVTEYCDLCDLRLALETHAAGKAALNRTEGDLREIGGALEAMRVLTERVIAARQKSPLMLELAREDARFHVAIIAAAKNLMLKQEILRLHLINRVLAGPVSPTPDLEGDFARRRRFVLKSHEAIYDAIGGADDARARQEMEGHIKEMIDHGIRLMGSDPAGTSRTPTAEELAYLP